VLSAAVFASRLTDSDIERSFGREAPRDAVWCRDEDSRAHFYGSVRSLPAPAASERIMLNAPAIATIEDYLQGKSATMHESMPRKIHHWLADLCTWNRKLDLTAAKTEHDLLELMVADALELARVVPQGTRLVDVGAGAGGPGLALAIVRPDLHVTLVDSLAKRTSFLRTAVSHLEMTSTVTVKACDATTLPLASERWQVAISRATFSPTEWVDLAAQLVHPRGHVAALLAQDQPPEHPLLELVQNVDYSSDAKKRALAWYARR
jgi:16S rRNA (guanine527-N7)-methyltransferase